MDRETQDLVGGVLIVLGLIFVEWWQYRMGVSSGPWPFQSLFRYLFWPAAWMPAAYRELDARSFWLNIIYGCGKIVIVAVTILYLLGYLRH